MIEIRKFKCDWQKTLCAGMAASMTPEDQADMAVGGAGRGVEEGRPRFVSDIFIIRLRIKARQIFYARSFDGILTRDDIAGAQPRREARVIIRMCAVDRHRLREQQSFSSASWHQGQEVKCAACPTIPFIAWVF